MNNRAVITTQLAPAAIGPYSQAIKIGNIVWLSGQIPIDPDSMQVVAGGIDAQARQAFHNLQAVAQAAGGSLRTAVKVNISLVDLGDFQTVNAVMAEFFSEPYPARACIGVSALPKGVSIEIEAVLAI